MRLATRCATLVVVVAIAVLGSAPGAAAHAVFTASEPRPDAIVDATPDRVVARFNEPVELAFGSLRVFDTNARRVDDGDARHPAGDLEAVEVGLADDLTDGTYTATYRVVSADGHPIDGAFVFHIGEPRAISRGIADQLLSAEGGAGRGEDVAFIVVRWANFAALLLLTGAWFFRSRIWSFRGAAESDTVDRAFASSWRRLLVWSWVAAVVLTLAGLVLQGSIVADVSWTGAFDPAIQRELAETRYGTIAIAKLALLVVAAGLWVASGRGARGPARPAFFAGMSVAAALLATPGLAGHAGSVSPVPFNVAADVVHVVAAGVWLGGLVVLLRVAFPASEAVVYPMRAADVMRGVVARFSTVAMWAVGLVVVTGIARSLVEVGAWRALFGEPYGWVLLAKVGAVVPMVALGAYNQRILKPRLDGAVDDENLGTALARLRRTVRIEAAAGVVVVLLTAVLVNVTPPRGEAGGSGPFITDVALGTDRLNVIVDPTQVGENIIHLTVTSSSGRPVEIEAMSVELELGAEDIGPIDAEGRRIETGHFVVQGRQLSVAGEWRMRVFATYDRFTDRTAIVTVPVG